MKIARQYDDGWNLPGTGLLWLVPVCLPWFALGDLGVNPPARVFRILQGGTSLVVLYLAIGLCAAWRTRHEARSSVRRTVLRAFPATACAIGVASLWFATRSDDSGIWLALAPCLVWLLCTFLTPFWRDDEFVVQSREPDTGWKSLLGFRLAYSDARDPVLWVRMRSPIPFREGIGYTPNFGHIWGRLAFAMLPGSALAGAMLIALAVSS